MKKLDLWSIRLRELRKSKDLTQPGLAKKSGISQGEISQLENGKRPFTQATLDKILKALGADYEQLFVKSRQPVASIDYKKWNDDLRTIRDLEKELKGYREIIKYAKKNCTMKTCPILQKIA